jgi:hypothetical protein
LSRGHRSALFTRICSGHRCLHGRADHLALRHGRESRPRDDGPSSPRSYAAALSPTGGSSP